MEGDDDIRHEHQMETQVSNTSGTAEESKDEFSDDEMCVPCRHNTGPCMDRHASCAVSFLGYIIL